MSCLLCAGLLPKDEEEVVEQHMKDHHRVFTNMTLVVAASKLEESQLAVVTKMVVDMGVAKVVVRIWEDQQKNSIDENKKDFPKMDTEVFKESGEVEFQKEEDEGVRERHERMKSDGRKKRRGWGGRERDDRTERKGRQEGE